MGKGSTRFAVTDAGRPIVRTASIAAPVRAPAPASTAELRQRLADRAKVGILRPDAVAVVAILLTTALVSWQRLWLQNGLAHLDISTFYLPWYAYMGEHLRHFDIPGWNPYLFSGTAFAGDPQSGWMYLPAMVIFSAFDAVRAYQVYLIFHLVLAGLGTYAYARVIGLRPLPAVAAAFAFELGPLVNHISCCVIHVQLAVWIPIALLGVELMMRAGTRTGRAAAWVMTGFAVSQMLAAWIGQGAYNGLLVVAGYIAFRALFTQVEGLSGLWRRLLRTAIDGAATMLIGIGLAAAGLWPRLDVVNRTNLAGGNYSGHEVDAYSAGWPLKLFLDRILSDDNGYLSLTFYLGGPVIALMVMAPYLGRVRFRIPFFIGVTLFASVLTLQTTPFHRLLYLVLPKFEALHSHVPSRILAIQWIGPAMLTGITVELLCQERLRERVKHAAILGLAVWGVGIVALTAWREGIALATIVCALAACAVVAAFALPAVWSGRVPDRMTQPQLALGLLLILLVVLDPAGRGFAATVLHGQQPELLAVPTGPVSRDAVDANAATTDPRGAGAFFQTLRDGGEVFRYIGYDYSLYEAGSGYPTTYREYYWLPEAQALLVNARGMMLGLDDAQGYDPMQLSNYINAILFANHAQQNYHDSQIMPSAIGSPILDMLNVRYVVIPNRLDPGRPRDDLMQLIATYKEVFRNDTIRVLENPHALPRAWTVHTAYAATNDFGLLMIDSGLVDPRTTAFLDPKADVPLLGQPPAGASDQVTITNTAADHMELQATMAASGLVLVGDTYDRDWVAYVDGKNVPLFQANGVIRAVPVPAGTHAVKLAYEPKTLRAGLVISGAFTALAGAILAAFVWTRLGLPPARSRKPRPAPLPV